MSTKEAITLFKYYLQSNHKRRTIESYTLLLDRFNAIHAGRLLGDISPDEIFHFLEDLTRALAKSTRRLRYAQLKAFYNFIINRCSLNMRNPCNLSLPSKSFKAPKQVPHKILERETVDEMIYNTTRRRDRLILELQARCGLRIGELLEIRVADVSDRTITLREPKSGKAAERAYMPENVSKKLVEYIKGESPSRRDEHIPHLLFDGKVPCQRIGSQIECPRVTSRPPEIFSDLCQPKRCPAGSSIESNLEAPRPEDHPGLSRQDQ